MELHPCFQQPDLYEFVVDAGCSDRFRPIARPRARIETRTETTPWISRTVISRHREATGRAPGNRLCQMGGQRGPGPIPFSIYRNEY